MFPPQVRGLGRLRRLGTLWMQGLRRAHHSGTLWVRNLDWPKPEVVPHLPAVFARAGPEASALLAEVLGLDPGQVRERFTPERRCYVARVEGALAACGWVSFTEEAIGELRLHIRLLPGEAYIWNCVTAPPYRRCRLYSALLVHIAAELQAAGLCRTWIGADRDNLPSQRGMAAAGFQPVADLVVTWLMAIRQVRVYGCPGAPEPWVAQARHALLGHRNRAWLSVLRQP